MYREKEAFYKYYFTYTLKVFTADITDSLQTSTSRFVKLQPQR